MKNRAYFTIAIFIMACVFRTVCAHITGMDIVLIMAFINAFSLMFVVYLLIHDIECRITKTIRSYSIYEDEKTKMLKWPKLILNVVMFVSLTAFGVTYMFCYNEIFNDIISIVALGLSIITSDLSEAISDFIIATIKKQMT